VTSTLEKVSPVNHLLPAEEWSDVTVRDPETLLNFWNSRFKEQPRLRDLSAILKSGFGGMNSEELPQIGHLVHLSTIPAIENRTFEEMMELARFDVRSLAKVLIARGPNSRRLHIGLRIGASAVHPISTDDLAYILSDIDDRPGYDDALGLTIQAKSNEVDFPESPPIVSLALEYLHELEHLESLGYIRTSTQGVRFSHPDFVAVSTDVLASGSAIALADRLSILDRGLASLNEFVARRCATTLPVFYRAYGNTADARQLIYDIGKRATSSIFPGVRDIALDAIIDWLPTLQDNARRDAMSLIRNDDYSYGDIRWKGDIPWTSSIRGWEDLFSAPDFSDRSNFEDLLKAITTQNSDRVPTPLEAWNLVHYIEARPMAPGGANALCELTKQSHAFIRAKAAALLIERRIDSPDV